MNGRLEPYERLAIQKQEELTPIIKDVSKTELHFVCPICGYDRYYHIVRIYRPNYCEDCGQKFNWKEFDNFIKKESANKQWWKKWGE